MKRFLFWLGAAMLGIGAVAAQSADHGVAPAPEAAKPLAVGAKAPTAMLAGPTGGDVDLAKVLGEKPTILIFFRGGWCPFCNRHLATLAEAELDLRKLGFQIVGITPEPFAKLNGTMTEDHVRYRLLSDEKMAVSAQYGVAYRISKENGAGYKENGIALTHIPGSEDFWLPVPAAFIVGRDAAIKYVYWNADPSVRITNEQLLAEAKKALE
jgi:peroxiredoxin